MDQECNFYICTVCFNTAESEQDCRGQTMLHCGTFQPGDERLKPLLDSDGELKSRAPRWFLERLQVNKD